MSSERKEQILEALRTLEMCASATAAQEQRDLEHELAELEKMDLASPSCPVNDLILDATSRGLNVEFEPVHNPISGGQLDPHATGIKILWPTETPTGDRGKICRLAGCTEPNETLDELATRLHKRLREL